MVDPQKQQFLLTFKPMGNLESPINLKQLLECGRKPEQPVTTHADMQTQKAGGFEPGTFVPLGDIANQCQPGLNYKLITTQKKTLQPMEN